jgi:mRNA interferase YafQ
MYQLKLSTRFQRQLKRVERRKEFRPAALAEALRLLAERGQLPARLQDHPLKGSSLGLRECHVQNDFLITYERDEKVRLVTLVEIGTHADLFGT